jgi:ribosomal protein L4
MIKLDKDINVYDVLKYKKLVLTKKALENLTALFKAR